MKRINSICINVCLLISTLLFVSCESKPKVNEIVKIKGDYLCISLTNYSKEINRLLQNGETVPADIDSLYGMSWLEGYVVDYVKKDIIMVGKIIQSRPTYHTEDLFVNFQNVFDSISSPFCSLDPIPENILKLNECLNNTTDNFETIIKNCQEAIGGQKIVVGGVPRNSRHAKIMIFADYDMKKISQGSLAGTGIRSCIDFALQDTINNDESGGTGSNMSRFWFHIKENNGGNVYPNYIENDGIVFINECPVVVLTEKQIADADGNLTDNADQVDESADLFAFEISSKFTDLANKSMIFAELENLFRLQACFKALKMKNEIELSGADLSSLSGFSLKPGINDLPETLPGLVNYRAFERTKPIPGGHSIEKQIYIAAGGVSQEMSISESNLLYTETIGKTSEIIINQRPNEESIVWTVNMNASN
jgi:hypothetical protein